MSEKQIVIEIVEYFNKNIFENHLQSILKKHTKLKSYKINPILVKYLSKLLEDNYTPKGVAKALMYPRVLGTSINTSFGAVIQKMFVELGIAEGSMISGMDIDFIDKKDKRKKWCQLKSGPNTINSEDVAPLIAKFNSTINLARTNYSFKNINNTDFVVGVLYGSENELSMHYKKIDKLFPVYIGKEFWYRLTGSQNMYSDLVEALHENISSLKTKNTINLGLEILEEEISNSSLFEFKSRNLGM